MQVRFHELEDEIEISVVMSPYDPAQFDYIIMV